MNGKPRQRPRTAAFSQISETRPLATAPKLYLPSSVWALSLFLKTSDILRHHPIRMPLFLGYFQHDSLHQGARARIDGARFAGGKMIRIAHYNPKSNCNSAVL
jgi:hypothetical protein